MATRRFDILSAFSTFAGVLTLENFDVETKQKADMSAATLVFKKGDENGSRKYEKQSL